MTRKRYLFFDIDGTLLAGTYEHSYIPESTKRALALLRDAGHFLCIATSRSEVFAVNYLNELGFENMISDGGYGLTLNKKYLGSKALDKDAVVKLLAECDEKDIPWGIQIDNSTTRLVRDTRFDEFTHDFYMQSKIIPDIKAAAYPEIYKAFIACYPPEEEGLVNLKGLQWCRYDKEYFIVEHTEKAVGIRRVMDSYHADYADAIVFGDAKNDLSMFSKAWTNVAMGNAVPELKAQADYVTDAVDKDGIYNACRALGLW